MDNLKKELELYLEEEFNITEEGLEDTSNLSDEELNEIVRRINYFKEEIGNVEMIAEKELKRYENIINSYKDKKVFNLKSRLDYYEGIIEDYATKTLKDKKKRSISLPFGTISLRKQAPKYEYETDKVLNFLKENKYDEFINVKFDESVNKIDLKKAITKDVDGNAYLNGEKIDGLKIVEQKDKLLISNK